ncbi:DedA family protein [Microbacterium barkeri]|uniref:DedA family protein n=1 Tax=Microbacterium barkeri TaxID=33917 RepID=UPI0024AE983D|nr:DedA family protein [Microbacterium barkeri]MDI6942136.1 DedA family protein [Microbacterium barkeri]
MTAFFDLVATVLLDTATSPWIYLVAFAVCAVDGLFPPVPSETVIVSAAAIGAATGEPVPWLIALLAACGAFVGDGLTYLLGRAIGTERFGWMRIGRVRRTIEWAQAGLDRRGASLILIARYIPVGRVAVNLTAGATRYPPRRFVPLALVAAAAWAAYSVGIGLIAGTWLREQPLLGAAIGAGIAIVLGIAIDRVIALRQRSLSPEAERTRTEPAGIPAS